jgi:aminopeptidase N
MFKNGLIILIFVLAGSAAFAQQPDPYFTDKMALNERQRFLMKSAFNENQTYAEYDLIYQRMQWQIDPGVKYIQGSVTSYFKSQLQQLSVIEFDLRSQMTVDSVIQNRQRIAFTHKNDKLAIKIRPLVLNETDSVKVFYRGIPESEGPGFGSFVANKHAGVPVLWTLSEPYGAMEWWPCKQSLADKIDSIDVIVTTPEIYRTASNGILVLDNVKAGSRTMHWKHRSPIATYLVAVAVTNYAIYSDWCNLDDGRKIEILNYVYPENLEKAKKETPVTVEFIGLFNRLFGEYPFANEKYGHAQFGWGGGMEHQTMSFMSDFNYELVAHELAHQWFGDYITCGSWSDIWLNEGFATYLAGLVYENQQNGYWWSTWKKLNVNRIVSQPGGSVFVKDTTNINTIFSSRLSYSKGAYLLHMLRFILGDDAFFKGMRNYFNDPQITNGFALTNQLVKHMEVVGDTTLTEFFNDWFYGEGFPVYNARFKPAEPGFLNISLSQTPSHPSVSFYEMPVPVRVYNANHRDSADFRLTHTKNNQEFKVKVDFPVTELVIDPDLWLVSKTTKVVKAEKSVLIDNFSVFPNPFNGRFSVKVPQGEQLLNLQVFSADGSLIKQFNGTSADFDLHGLPAGIYLFKIQTNKSLFETKIIRSATL